MADDGRKMGVTGMDLLAQCSHNVTANHQSAKDHKTMTKLTLPSVVSIAIGLVLWASYAVQGSYIDENGVLQEPFHLLALGWFFVLMGFTVLAGDIVVRFLRKRRKTD